MLGLYVIIYHSTERCFNSFTISLLNERVAMHLLLRVYIENADFSQYDLMYMSISMFKIYRYKIYSLISRPKLMLQN